MLRNTRDGYGLVAIAFHWTIAALFVVQAALGFRMSDMEDSLLKLSLYQWHKSFGLLILVLALTRLAWRLANPVPALPETLRPWEKRTARASHYMLYAGLIVVPLLGWATVSASPLGVPTLAFYLLYVPHLPVQVGEAAEAALAATHGALATFVAAVALLHVAAALRHHFWLGDDVLRRMLRPPRAGRRAVGPMKEP